MRGNVPPNCPPVPVITSAIFNLGASSCNYVETVGEFGDLYNLNMVFDLISHKNEGVANDLVKGYQIVDGENFVTKYDHLISTQKVDASNPQASFRQYRVTIDDFYYQKYRIVIQAASIDRGIYPGVIELEYGHQTATSFDNIVNTHCYS